MRKQFNVLATLTVLSLGNFAMAVDQAADFYGRCSKGTYPVQHEDTKTYGGTATAGANGVIIDGHASGNYSETHTERYTTCRPTSQGGK